MRQLAPLTLVGEVADVFAYLLQIADILDIDLAAALRSKMRRNELKYPVERARGRADKYDRLAAEGHDA